MLLKVTANIRPLFEITDVYIKRSSRLKPLGPLGPFIYGTCTGHDGWLVGCLGLNGPLRQYFSLYRAVSKREGEKERK